MNGMINKPSFKTYTMAEVNQKADTNGYTAVSTFSGGGGSSIGLKLAGFHIPYAVEFIKHAKETYELNHPKTYVDGRDIRKITGKDILKKINVEKYELDLLEGSPPCASFSNCGMGQAGWNKVKTYSDTKQRVDDLFFEFTRLCDEIKPKMTICENVSALATGNNKGYLKLIIKEFKKIGYDIKLFNVDCSLLDVPQTRKRLIFIGIRDDLNITFTPPKPNNYRYSIDDIFDDFENHVPTEDYHLYGKDTKFYEAQEYCIKHHISSVSKAKKELYGKGASFNYRVLFKEDVAPTLVQGTEHMHGYQMRSISIDEAKRIQTFPEDYKLTGGFQKQWERIGRSVPPRVYEKFGLQIKEALDNERQKH